MAYTCVHGPCGPVWKISRGCNSSDLRGDGTEDGDEISFVGIRTGGRHLRTGTTTQDSKRVRFQFRPVSLKKYF